MTVGTMTCRDFADFATVHGLRHELELRAGDAGWRTPETNVICFSQVE